MMVISALIPAENMLKIKLMAVRARRPTCKFGSERFGSKGEKARERTDRRDREISFAYTWARSHKIEILLSLLT